MLLGMLVIGSLLACTAPAQSKPESRKGRGRDVEVIRYEAVPGACSRCVSYVITIDSDGRGLFTSKATGPLPFKASRARFKKFRRILRDVRPKGEIILDDQRCNGTLEPGYQSFDIVWLRPSPGGPGMEPMVESHLRTNLGCARDINGWIFEAISKAKGALPIGRMVATSG